MSKTRRNMCVIILLTLLLVPAVQVVAATQTFFTNNLSHGFSCTASGTISSTTCHLYFTATALPTTPVQPWEMYNSKIHAYTYSSGGDLKSNQEIVGDCSCVAHLYNSTGWYFGHVDCNFTFIDARVGEPSYSIAY